MKCVWSGRYLYVKAFVTKMACVYSWCSMRARGLDVFWFVAAVAKFISQVWNQPFSFTRHDLKVSFQDWRCPEEGCFISEVSENSQLSAILFLKAFRAKPFFFFFFLSCCSEKASLRSCWIQPPALPGEMPSWFLMAAICIPKGFLGLAAQRWCVPCSQLMWVGNSSCATGFRGGDNFKL